eukprot:6641867-Lingulodinium_polyedra.AAC.1
MCPVSAGTWVAPLHLQHSPAPAAEPFGMSFTAHARHSCHLSPLGQRSPSPMQHGPPAADSRACTLQPVAAPPCGPSP